MDFLYGSCCLSGKELVRGGGGWLVWVRGKKTWAFGGVVFFLRGGVLGLGLKKEKINKEGRRCGSFVCW